MTAVTHESLGDLLPEWRVPLPLWKRSLYIFLGIVCLVLGVVGWLVPVITGIPFYVAAVAFLGASSRLARRCINWGDRKLPLRARVLLRAGRLEHPKPAPGATPPAPRPPAAGDPTPPARSSSATAPPK